MDRLTLYYTPIAGYVHTVEAVIEYAGVRERIDPVAIQPFAADSPLAAINPLGTVPTLVLPDGEYLAGGPVIYEYLDSLHRRRRLYPAKGPQRFTTLRQAWLADALFDTFVQLIVESWQPHEQQRAAQIERHWAKLQNSLAQMERDCLRYGRIDIAQLRAVGALQFLLLKWAETARALTALPADFKLAARQPHLAAWLKSMARRKLFRRPLQQ